ncbi:hypothetical protein VPH35_120791 [Triticum aestivum]
MEARTDHQQTSGDLSPGQPRWVLLERRGDLLDDADDMLCEDPDAIATPSEDPNAIATRSEDHPDAETRGPRCSCAILYFRSGGRLVRVSFRFAAPPAVSRLRVDSPGLPDGTQIHVQIIAAHRDSVLMEIKTSRPGLSWSIDERDSSDYFGAPRRKRYMPAKSTALLRRGDEDLLVAQLTLWGTEGEAPLEAELCLLRSGRWDCELKGLPVLHGDGKRQELSFWQTDAVIPVGDRFLYWVDYCRGVIFSDAWEEMPQLRYVSLPVEPQLERRSQHSGGWSNRRVCTTDGGGAVRFVQVFPRCCCGCPGATFCSRSRYAFNITTWTLRMDDMTTWDKVGVVDSDELWSLPGYGGVLPRIRPLYPIVSLDDPDVLCFMVHKVPYHMEDVDGDHTIRLIEVDTKRMELRSPSSGKTP